MNKYVVFGSAAIILISVFLYYSPDSSQNPVTLAKTKVPGDSISKKENMTGGKRPGSQKESAALLMKVNKKKNTAIREEKIPQLEAVYANENGVKMMEELDKFIKSDMPEKEKLAAMVYYINHYSSNQDFNLVLDYFRELKMREIAPALVKNYDSIIGERNKIKTLDVLDELNTFSDEERLSGKIEMDYDKLVPFFSLVIKIATQPGGGNASKGEFTKASEIYIGFLDEKETKHYVENNLFTPSNEIPEAKKIGMVINKMKEGPEYEKALSGVLKKKLEEPLPPKDEVWISDFAESVVNTKTGKALVSDKTVEIIYEALKERVLKLEEKLENINSVSQEEADRIADALVAMDEGLNTLSSSSGNHVTSEKEISSLITEDNSPLKNAILINSRRYTGNYEKPGISIDPKVVEDIKKRLAEENKGSNTYKILANAIEKLKTNNPDYEEMNKETLNN